MPVSTTDRARQRQAAIDLASKLRLEIDFVRKMRSFFADVRGEFRDLFALNGTIFDITLFRQELETLLTRQYARTAAEFTGRLTDELTKNFLYETKQGEEETVTAAVALLMANRSQRQAQFILATTQAEMDAAIAVVQAEALAADEFLDNDEIAERASRRLVRPQSARSSLIAATEVNAMAEATKLTEFETLVALGVTLESGEALSSVVVKRWDAVLDEKTRINHAVADGQQRASGDPFVVGGQLLLHPGDTSLGATADNIINCRCSTQFVTGRPTRL